MRVEATKVADGFLIPFTEGLRDISHEKIVLDIELVELVELIEPAPEEPDYAALDQLVGLCEAGDTNASLEHDRRIYRRQNGS